jgi:hypothetical protein
VSNDECAQTSVPERFLRFDPKSSGCSRGSWTVSNISALASARPPTSSHDTFGILGAPIFWLYEDRASSIAISKSAFVSDTPAEKMSFGVTPSPLGVYSATGEFSSRAQKKTYTTCMTRVTAA